MIQYLCSFDDIAWAQVGLSLSSLVVGLIVPSLSAERNLSIESDWFVFMISVGMRSWVSRTVAYSDMRASCMGSASIPCNLLEWCGSGGGGLGGILMVRRCRGAVLLCIVSGGLSELALSFCWETVLFCWEMVLFEGVMVLFEGVTVFFSVLLEGLKVLFDGVTVLLFDGVTVLLFGELVVLFDSEGIVLVVMVF